jgi:hypothetical protein
MTNPEKTAGGNVEKYVEKNGKKWKKMENYSYFCRR